MGYYFLDTQYFPGLRTEPEVGLLDSTELDLTDLLSSPLYTSKFLGERALDTVFMIQIQKSWIRGRKFWIW